MMPFSGGRRARIFISYRRQDTAYPADRLYVRLVDHFGQGQVFKDIYSLRPGDNFAQVIHNAVGSCSVLLALIGKQWLTITGDDGRRRLDNPKDLLRVEIETALGIGVGVIPILVDGARIPPAHALPGRLARLRKLEAFELNPSRLDADIDRLIAKLDERSAETYEPAWHDQILAETEVLTVTIAGAKVSASTVPGMAYLRACKEMVDFVIYVDIPNGATWPTTSDQWAHLFARLYEETTFSLSVSQIAPTPADLRELDYLTRQMKQLSMKLGATQ